LLPYAQSALTRAKQPKAHTLEFVTRFANPIRPRPTWPPVGEPDLEVDAGHALDHLDHLKHREVATVSPIEGRRSTAAAQTKQRVRMRADEVADVDVVADAGSVRREIVSAKHTRPDPRLRHEP
jgi:hypothetical protein